MLTWSELVYRGAILLLGVAFLTNFGTLFARRSAHTLLGTLGSHGSWVLLTVSLALRALARRHFPIQSEFEAVVLFVWTSLTGFVLLERRLKWSAMNVVFLFLAEGALLYSLGLPRDLTPLLPALRSRWLPVHVTLNFAAYAALTLAFVIGLLYLGQEWQLKRKRYTFFYNLLPPLDQLERMVHILLRWGFPLLTLGLIAGSLYARMVWGFFWDWRNPKLTWSFVMWLIYAGYFGLHEFAGWRGRRAVLWTVVGFLALVVNYGISLMVKNPHSFLQQFIG
ncbi:MAG: cytochrome c biogenesis protein [Bacillota bacterium]|nr:cytochrome c biogenesis protein [Bacillota bacterium]